MLEVKWLSWWECRRDARGGNLSGSNCLWWECNGERNGRESKQGRTKKTLTLHVHCDLVQQHLLLQSNAQQLSAYHTWPDNRTDIALIHTVFTWAMVVFTLSLFLKTFQPILQRFSVVLCSCSVKAHLSHSYRYPPAHSIHTNLTFLHIFSILQSVQWRKFTKCFPNYHPYNSTCAV